MQVIAAIHAVEESEFNAEKWQCLQPMMASHAQVIWSVMFLAMRILAQLIARSVIGKKRPIAQSPAAVARRLRFVTGWSGHAMVVCHAQEALVPGCKL
jgi:hypothetical protein